MTNNDRSSSALLIIDMINPFDFEHGPTLASKTEKIVDPILQIKRKFQQASLPIIYINDHYNLWQADYRKIIEHCRTKLSTSIIDSIAPDETDYFLIKPKHSAFYGTALNTLLHQLKIQSLVITGIAGNICVLFTANDAYMREYSIHIPNNTIASVSDQDNEYALEMIKNCLKGNTLPLA